MRTHETIVFPMEASHRASLLAHAKRLGIDLQDLMHDILINFVSRDPATIDPKLIAEAREFEDALTYRAPSGTCAILDTFAFGNDEDIDTIMRTYVDHRLIHSKPADIDLRYYEPIKDSEAI